jgi:hypothetical protein
MIQLPMPMMDLELRNEIGKSLHTERLGLLETLLGH